jgi:hypothetical protein
MPTRNDNRKAQWVSNSTARSRSGEARRQSVVQTEASIPQEVNGVLSYLEMTQAVSALRQERQRMGVTLTEVSRRSGIDLGALSRLENGHQTNPTLETLSRYAAAIGKRFLWVIQDLPPSLDLGAPAEGDLIPTPKEG